MPWCGYVTYNMSSSGARTGKPAPRGCPISRKSRRCLIGKAARRLRLAALCYVSVRCRLNVMA